MRFPHLRIDLLREVHDSADVPALLVGDRGEPCSQVAANPLVVLGVDDALGLPALDVEDDAGVVAALAPGHRTGPVDPTRASGVAAVGLVAKREQPFPPEPFVDPDAAVDALGAVIGDDEDDGVLVGVCEQAADELVDVAVVVEDGVLYGPPATCFRCAGSMYFQNPWCIRSVPISTMAKSSHGLEASRCSARANLRSVIS